MENFQEFKARKGGYSITLGSGRTIFLTTINQSYIYEGLLAGLPDAKLNEEIIERVLEDAKKFYSDSSFSPYLLKPETHEIELPAALKGRKIGHERIPYIACTAFFISEPTNRNKEADASHCTIVWFQDELAMPIDAAIMERIKAFDWDAHAVDFFI